MIATLIGVVIGLVIGLTGAGGALISIPLIMKFFSVPIKIATIYSLLAVLVAALINYVGQREFALHKLAWMISWPSFLGSFLGMWLKNWVNEIFIVGLLVLISVYGLFSVWFKGAKVINQAVFNPALTRMIFTGLILGILTTLTGLGGGILLIPILIGWFGLNQQTAIATGLLVVGLSSLVSVIIQLNFSDSTIHFDQNIWFMILGIIGSSSLLNYILKRTNSLKLALVQKLIFTIIVFISILQVLAPTISNP